MNRDLEDRIAVVLGGGSVGSGWGIGKAISVAYAKAGALVAVADKDLDAARETVALVEAEGGRAEAYAANILDDVELTAFLTGLLDRHGRVDILHCNVGLGKAGPSAETSPGDWRQICNANLTSVHVAVSAVAPAMREARRGVILTTSSIAGIRDVGYPHVAYGATKAAAIHLMRLLAIENAPYGIRANSIIAGLVDTPRIEKTLAKSYGGRTLEEMKSVRASQCPMGRMGTAFDIADAAVFLASDKASYITGTELLVDGGLAATVRQSGL